MHLAKDLATVKLAHLNSFKAHSRGTSRIMKRYERKWKHICLKRVAHRSVQESTEPKTETRKEQQEKQLVLQK